MYFFIAHFIFKFYKYLVDTKFKKLPNNISTFIDAVKLFREMFPLSDSFVAVDILFVIYSEEKIKIKDLYLSVPHSYTAIRSHHFRLVRDDWIKIESCHHDKRIKYVVASEKLSKLFFKFSKNVETAHKQGGVSKYLVST